MKYHVKKTRTQNGKTVSFSIPECGKKGSVNIQLNVLSLDSFKSVNKKDCCINCLASIK
jgi:hypothetical protein